MDSDDDDDDDGNIFSIEKKAVIEQSEETSSKNIDKVLLLRLLKFRKTHTVVHNWTYNINEILMCFDEQSFSKY